VYYEAKAGTEERNLGLREMPKQFTATMGDGIGAREHNKEQSAAWKQNNHPTVKPISLTRYLASLLLPPAEYAPRRVFVPFSGVASEMIGAMQAGWDEIVGVELTEEYIPIAKARIEYWRNRGWQTELFKMDSNQEIAK
jgi:DNA modification methylase